MNSSFFTNFIFSFSPLLFLVLMVVLCGMVGLLGVGVLVQAIQLVFMVVVEVARNILIIAYGLTRSGIKMGLVKLAGPQTENSSIKHSLPPASSNVISIEQFLIERPKP